MKADEIALMLCEARKSAHRLILRDDPYNALQMLDIIYALEEKLLGKEHATQEQAEERIPS